MCQGDKSFVVCKSGITNARKIWLTRHGESQYNQLALIGGDSSLSPNGEMYAHALPEVLMSRVPRDSEAGDPVPVSVWTSTLKRTIQTASYLPFPKLRWKALDEIDAGICDGMTYAEISEKHPEEFAARKRDKLRYRYPRGESYLDLVQRLEPVITEMERQGESIAIVGHQAVLRVIYGYLMAKPQEEIPRISIPLHTLIELTPMPDGTMSVEYIPIPVGTQSGMTDSMQLPEPHDVHAGPPALPASTYPPAVHDQLVQLGSAEDLTRVASCSSKASFLPGSQVPSGEELVAMAAAHIAGAPAAGQRRVPGSPLAKSSNSHSAPVAAASGLSAAVNGAA